MSATTRRTARNRVSIRRPDTRLPPIPRGDAVRRWLMWWTQDEAPPIPQSSLGLSPNTGRYLLDVAGRIAGNVDGLDGLAAGARRLARGAPVKHAHIAALCEAVRVVSANLRRRGLTALAAELEPALYQLRLMRQATAARRV